ncbi:UBP-type zinc finger domain-containing protein [Rhodococcus sp. 1.20]
MPARRRSHESCPCGPTCNRDPGRGAPYPQGCEECLRLGTPWVHLRLCLTCGHVGCCDSSPGRHASAHAHAIGHPIVQSMEPGEDWRWCYVDQNFV